MEQELHSQVEQWLEVNDCSAMDAEEIDVSVSTADQLGNEAAVSDSSEEEEEESSSSIISESEAGVEKDADDDQSDSIGRVECKFRDSIAAPVSWSDNETGDSDNRVEPPMTPAIDITMAPSYEVKRIYSDLIDSCRGLDDTSLSQHESDKILHKNITTGVSYFRQMETTLRHNAAHESTTDGESGLGNSASEFFLACLHTKTCSQMLQNAVRQAGVGEQRFTVNDFLDKLHATFVDAEGGYSVMLATRQLAFTSASASYSVSHLNSIYGLIDKDNFKTVGACPDPAPAPLAKVRAPRKKDDEENSTQKEIMNDNLAVGNPEKIDQTSEGVAKGILKAVKAHYREDGAPTNMLDIVQADNVSEVVSRLFGVTFLVREGHVSLSESGSAEASANGTGLVLKPDQPPAKNESGETRNQRSQHIASFSAKFLKQMIESGKGFDFQG